ncbi:Separin [Smittium mucronatum]|uniref:separase n=1 Tax=Smittium mucronatum TaxID=133383 RepID=A0A1R0H5I4_9FUNG|nr:Separin [Smittium mucronatum]
MQMNNSRNKLQTRSVARKVEFSSTNMDKIKKDDEGYLEFNVGELTDTPIGKGKYSSIPISREDELENLQNEFRTMSVKRPNIPQKLLFAGEDNCMDHSEFQPNKIMEADRNSVFYLLNPGGDLTRTQQIFEPIIKVNGNNGWGGIVGREPLNQEVIYGLLKSEIYLYFGHGGGDKYLKRTQLKSIGLMKMGVLMGCSSGKIFDSSGYDFSGESSLLGIGYNGSVIGYLVSESFLSVIGNLFDVGDKDIDSFSLEFMKNFGLLGQDSQTKRNYECSCCFVFGEKRISNVQAVAMSRSKCKMEYLTGCAPVVYGLPVYCKEN